MRPLHYDDEANIWRKHGCKPGFVTVNLKKPKAQQYLRMPVALCFLSAVGSIVGEPEVGLLFRGELLHARFHQVFVE